MAKPESALLILSMDIFKPQVKKSHYFRKKYDDLNRFISYFYQIDLVRSVAPETVLEVGVGNGMVSDYLKKLKFKVTTVDLDEQLKPDYVADVRSLPFKDNTFDVVMAYEVLEHIPFEEFESSLSELRRVSKKYILISLPYRSTGFEIMLKFPFMRTILQRHFVDLFLRIPLRFRGFKASGQHHWEIDWRRYSLRKVRKAIQRHLTVAKEVRPVFNSYHYFFVLEK